MNSELLPQDWALGVELWAHLTLKDLASLGHLSDVEADLLAALEHRAATRRSLLQERWGRTDRRDGLDRRVAPPGVAELSGRVAQLTDQLEVHRAVVQHAVDCIDVLQATSAPLAPYQLADVLSLLRRLLRGS